jgi:hypothetical protein
MSHRASAVSAEAEAANIVTTVAVAKSPVFMNFHMSMGIKLYLVTVYLSNNKIQTRQPKEAYIKTIPSTTNVKVRGRKKLSCKTPFASMSP